MFSGSCTQVVRLKRSIYVLILLFSLVKYSELFGQSGYMTVSGRVVLGEKGLSGAKVVLMKNDKRNDEALTNSSGKYTFDQLKISPEGDIYIIKISKPGHITVKHWLSTKAPDERETVFPDYFPEVELLKKVEEVEREKALSAILEKPISKFAYDSNKGDFTDDGAYFSTIKAKVNQLFEILEAEKLEQYRLLEEYRTNQAEIKDRAEEVNEQVEGKSSFELKFDEATARADQLFTHKDYRKSMTQYKQVLALVSKSGLSKGERDKLKKHSKKRIYELESLMAGLSEEELDKLEKVEEK